MAATSKTKYESLNPHSRVLDKIEVTQLDNKFPSLNGTQTSVTVVTRSHH